MTTAAKYRKKPVEIEAMQLPFGYPEGVDPSSDGYALNMQAARLLDWLNEHIQGVPPYSPGVGEWAIDPSDGALLIGTLEGKMKASPGDWIIRGVQGEFYPCKPDIFAATYEAVAAPINRGPWARLDNLPPIGSKLVAGNTGKVVYEVVDQRHHWSRGEVRLRDTRTGKSAGWHYPHYYRYVTEAVTA